MVELADTLVSGTSEFTLMGVQVPLRARVHKSEQCAGFMCVSYERKTAQPFFDSRLKRANSSSAQDLCASPITRSNASVTPCVLIRNRSRLSYLFIVSERMRYESLRTDKRKTLQAFFNFRLTRANPSSAGLATSAEREVLRAVNRERLLLM